MTRPWAEARDELLATDPEVREAYDELELAYRLARELLAFRAEHGLTRAQLAVRLRIPASTLARLEDMGLHLLLERSAKESAR